MRNIEAPSKEDKQEEVLIEEIHELREVLIKNAVEKGIDNHSVIRISEQLDSLIFQYQKMKYY
ncbi:MAG TPA: aspartyl-phosphate phosphatase Spo0E family protein [Niallia sp.]|nr:aspartyl-phosphate phosphatase Spo0E family protein [Niallia sp.]